MGNLSSAVSLPHEIDYVYSSLSDLNEVKHDIQFDQFSSLFHFGSVFVENPLPVHFFTLSVCHLGDQHLRNPNTNTEII